MIPKKLSVVKHVKAEVLKAPSNKNIVNITIRKFTRARKKMYSLKRLTLFRDSRENCDLMLLIYFRFRRL